MATFDDLLVWARDLLRDDVDTRRYFQEKYSRVLIDEFQDTDPLQAEIAFYLAAKPEADIDGQPWYRLPLQPGKLFIVGDVKQSIYRFRGADISVPQSVQASDELEILTLTENRRSQRPVLDWVNAVFAGLMSDQPFQAKYVELQVHSGVQQNDLDVTVHV